MYNPYVILNIKENATKEEIDEAYIRKLKEYNQNENAKDNNGNYEIQKLKQAHDDLINEDNRKRIDEELKNNREDYSLVPTDKKKNKSAKNVYINNEYVNTKITLSKKNIFDSKIKITKVYAILREDDYFTFASESYKYGFLTDSKYFKLFDMFLKENIFAGRHSIFASSPFIPWHYPDTVFETNRHLKAIVYPATKFVPFDLIDKNGYVYENDLRSIILYVNEYLKQHKGEIKEQIKEMKKNTYVEESESLVDSDTLKHFKIVNR